MGCRTAIVVAALAISTTALPAAAQKGPAPAAEGPVAAVLDAASDGFVDFGTTTANNSYTFGNFDCRVDPQVTASLRGVLLIGLYAEFAKASLLGAQPRALLSETSYFERDWLHDVAVRDFLRIIPEEDLLGAIDTAAPLITGPYRPEVEAVAADLRLYHTMISQLPIQGLADLRGLLVEPFDWPLISNRLDSFRRPGARNWDCYLSPTDTYDALIGGQSTNMTLLELEIYYVSFWLRRFDDGTEDLVLRALDEVEALL